MKRHTLYSMALLAALPFSLSASGWSTDELKQLQQQQNNVTKPALSTEQLHEQSKQWQTLSQNLQRKAMEGIERQAKNPKADASGVMIFASLGMPDNSLKQLLAQAADFNIPVVIRGLWQNDFAQTATKVQTLITPKDGEPIMGGVEINPVWFKQFNITSVPAFVVINEDKCRGKPPCNADDFDVLYGNVSIYDALDILQREGTHHAIAKKIATR